MKIPFIKKPETKNNPNGATISFYAVHLGEGKFEVYPALVSREVYSQEIILRLPLAYVFSSLPEIPDEYSNKDIFFLHLESRNDWGESFVGKQSLLEIDEVKKLCEKFEASVNRGTFISDAINELKSKKSADQ